MIFLAFMFTVPINACLGKRGLFIFLEQTTLLLSLNASRCQSTNRAMASDFEVVILRVKMLVLIVGLEQ